MSDKIKLHKLVFPKELEDYLKGTDREYICSYERSKILQKEFLSPQEQEGKEYVSIRFNKDLHEEDACFFLKELADRLQGALQRAKEKGEPVVVGVTLCLSLEEPGNRTSEKKIKESICQITGYEEDKVKVKETGRLTKIEIHLTNFTSVMKIFEKIQQAWDQRRFLEGIKEGPKAQKVQKAAQQEWEELREKLFIQQRLFDRIQPKAITSLLKQGCSVEPARNKQYTSLVLNSIDPRNNNQLRNKIFTLWTLVKSQEQSRQSHRIRIHLSIPNEKAGYVVGPQGAVLKHIRKSYCVLAFMRKNTDESSSRNYSTLILSGKYIQGVVNAIKKIQHLLDNADNAINMNKDAENCIHPAEHELHVKTPIWIKMIGKHGKTIKDLQKRLNVSLTFKGTNDEVHQVDRTLVIKGRSQEDVEKAILHLEKCQRGLKKSLEKIKKKKCLEQYFAEWTRRQQR